MRRRPIVRAALNTLTNGAMGIAASRSVWSAPQLAGAIVKRGRAESGSKLHARQTLRPR